MAETALEKIRREYDALPQWAKNLVAGLKGCAGYGGSSDESLFCGMPKQMIDQHEAFQVILEKEAAKAWWDGFSDLRDFAAAMSAPYPIPIPEPHAEITTSNLVEMVADEDECAFDQPCHYGNRVGGHAVYCHNDSWPNSPRKCRRSWYTGGETRDEDCPGFYPNNLFKHKTAK